MIVTDNKRRKIMVITELKVNNRKKYLGGFDISKIADLMGLSYSYENEIKSSDGQKYTLWQFYNKENNRPVKDNETMLKVKNTLQKYYPKAQLQGFTSRCQYAPEIQKKYLGVRIK